MKLKNVIVNTRSGVIHTRDCSGVEQMLPENTQVMEGVDPSEYEGSLGVCRHCMSQHQASEVLKWSLKHELERVEQRHRTKIAKEEERYTREVERTIQKYRNKGLTRQEVEETKQ